MITQKKIKKGYFFSKNSISICNSYFDVSLKEKISLFIQQNKSKYSFFLLEKKIKKHFLYFCVLNKLPSDKKKIIDNIIDMEYIEITFNQLVDNNIIEILDLKTSIEDELKFLNSTNYELINLETKIENFQSVIDHKLIIKKLNLLSKKRVNFLSSNLELFVDLRTLQLENKNIDISLGVKINVIYDIDNSNISYNINSNIINKSINDLYFIVFDIETTGLDLMKDEITEFSYIVFKNFRIIERESFLIKNFSYLLTPAITALTGINRDMLKNSGIDINIFLDKLKNILEKYKDIILISHSFFDFRVLSKYWEKYFKKTFNFCFIDNLELSKRFYRNFKSFSVSKLYKKIFNIVDSNATFHRAEYDTKITYQIIVNTFKKLGDITLSNLLNLENNLFRTNLSLILYPKNYSGWKKIKELLNSKLISTTIGNEKKYSVTNCISFSELLRNRENIIILYDNLNDYFFSHINEIIAGNRYYIEKILNNVDYISFTSIENIFNNEFSIKTFSNKFSIDSISKYMIEIINNFRDKIIFSPKLRLLYKFDVFVLKTILSYKGIRKHWKDKFFFYTIENLNIIYEQFKKNFCSIDNFVKSCLDNRERLLSSIFNIKSIIKHDEKLILSKSLRLDIGKDYDILKKEFKELIFLKLNTIFRNFNNIPKNILDRVNKEIKLVCSNNFFVIYYLSSIILNNIKKKFNISLGSRGSIGSSFIAYLLGITEINPLNPFKFCFKCKYYYELPVSNFLDYRKQKQCSKCNSVDVLCDGQNIRFEIFSGLEGNRLPDIDINVPANLQNDIIEFIFSFISNKFPQLSIIRGSTILKLKEKNSIVYFEKFISSLDSNNSNNYEYLRQNKSFICRLLLNIKIANGQHPGGLFIFNKSQKEYFYHRYVFLNDTPLKVSGLNAKFHSNFFFKLDILAHEDPSTLNLLYKLTNIKNIDLFDNNIFDCIKNFNNIMVIDKNDRRFKNRLGVLGLPEFSTNFTRSVMKNINLSKFSDLVKISGLCHGTDVWFNNAKNLLNDDISFDNIICVRDDIFDFLNKFGIEKNLSFEIMEFIRKGKQHYKYQKWLEYLNIIRDKVPEYFIRNCFPIKYLFPRAHATAYVNIAYKIMYFKIYFPLEFYLTFLERKKNWFSCKHIIVDNIKEIIAIKRSMKDKFTIKNKVLNNILLVLEEMFIRKIKISKISFRFSHSTNYIKYNNSILPPFSSIDSFGIIVCKKIVDIRKRNKFSSFNQIINVCKLNKEQSKQLYNFLSDEEKKLFPFIRQNKLF